MRVNSGSDLVCRAMGGDVAGVTGTTTSAPTATTVSDTGAPFVASAQIGHLVVMSGVYGVVVSNTTTVLTIDRWYTPGCVDEATEILTARGWLTVDELAAGDRVLGYVPERRLAQWEDVKAVNVYPALDRELIEMRHRRHSSLTTGDHRWPIESADYRTVKTITSADMNSKSCFYRGAPVSNLPDQPKYEDALVELVGWFCTEGNVGTSHGQPSNYIKIHQSTVNPENCDRIRAALTTVFGVPVDTFPRTGKILPSRPMWRETAPSARPQERVFVLNTVAGGVLQGVAPNRLMRPEFVSSLTSAQLDLLWSTWLAGDGSDEWSISQKDRARLDPLQMTLTLRGVGSALHPDRTGWELGAYRSNRFTIGTDRPRRIRYSGRVWCPTTESGYWLARREGRTFITGNSPGGAAAATPASGNYVVLPGQAPAWYMALTANSTAPAAGDTTLTGEITTAGGGLIRKLAAFAHTTGTSSYTLTGSFTANGSDVLPVTIAKMGSFQFLTAAGSALHQTLLNATATLSASGDPLTVTGTVNV